MVRKIPKAEMPADPSEAEIEADLLAMCFKLHTLLPKRRDIAARIAMLKDYTETVMAESFEAGYDNGYEDAEADQASPATLAIDKDGSTKIFDDLADAKAWVAKTYPKAKSGEPYASESTLKEPCANCGSDGTPSTGTAIEPKGVGDAGGVCALMPIDPDN